MAKFSKIEKVFLGITAVCLVILIYLGVCCGVFFRKKELPIAISSMGNYHIALEELRTDYTGNLTFSDSDFKKIVEDEICLKFYFYGRANLGETYNGLTLATIRTILIDERMSGYDYCVVFAHEAIHLKHFIGNERYVAFETFKFLYESEKLHDVGCYYAIRQIHGYYSGEYDVYDLIVDYLTNK